MAKGNCRYIRKLKPVLDKKFGKAKAGRMIEKAKWEYMKLCEDNKGESKALRKHTRERIYPAIASYHAILGEGVPPEEAAKILCRFFEAKSESVGLLIRALLHIPGLYRFVPKFFAKMTRQSFGEDAGFKANWLCADQKEMRFDMLVCPYHAICVAHGCSELVGGFCRADDICYGNMHPKLFWGRTKTLGLGGDRCDFFLKIIQKNTC